MHSGVNFRNITTANGRTAIPSEANNPTSSFTTAC
jgi:hypothetical protein